MVWSIMGLPYRIDQPLSIRLTALHCASQFELQSEGRPFSKGHPLPRWRQRWVLECEQSAKGLLLSLIVEPKSWLGQLWGPRVLGSANFKFEDVLAQPALFLDTQLPLSGFSLLGDAEGSPSLHVAVSMTPVEKGPYLLRTVFARGTDDSGGMVCEDVMLRNGFRLQRGRWVSRTVLDHAEREVFIVRKR